MPVNEGLAALSRDTAIDMAVFSGDLLYAAQDEAHGWALTLIVSNLFELVGDGDTSADRFSDGFAKIARLVSTETAVLGWDAIHIARAIRNWVDHGLQLDRPQEMNSRSKDRATVESVGMIPLLDDRQSQDIYRVYLNEQDRFEILFSPTKFWTYVQEWYESRILR